MTGEAEALSVCAQRCQSHYFSTTPHIMVQLHKTVTLHFVSSTAHKQAPLYMIMSKNWVCNMVILKQLVTLSMSSTFQFKKNFKCPEKCKKNLCYVELIMLIKIKESDTKTKAIRTLQFSIISMINLKVNLIICT